MKTLLVTGGCGFIGSHFIKGFLRSHPEWKILNLDKLTYCGNRENTKTLEGDARYEFIQADICDREAVNRAMEKAGAVVHFAAETHVDRSIEKVDDFLMTNVFGTRVLLDAARRFEIRRFLHISTDEVYGSIPQGAADEKAPLNPSSPYSASKAGADLLALSYWTTYKFPVIVTRSSNNFGPYQFPEKVIPLFITNLLEDKKVPLYGDGQNRRDWIYVEDHCAALGLVFDQGKEGEIYNIGGGEEISNLELTRRVFREMGVGEDRIHYVQDRLGHDFRYSVDTTKIKTLGFRLGWTFPAALKQTVDWYKQHAGWWQPLKRDKFTIK